MLWKMAVKSHHVQWSRDVWTWKTVRPANVRSITREKTAEKPSTQTSISTFTMKTSHPESPHSFPSLWTHPPCQWGFGWNLKFPGTQESFFSSLAVSVPTTRSECPCSFKWPTTVSICRCFRDCPEFLCRLEPVYESTTVKGMIDEIFFFIGFDEGVDWLIDWLIPESRPWLIDWLIPGSWPWLIDWLIPGSRPWLIDWLIPGNWHHVVLTWSSTDGSWLVTLDSIRIDGGWNYGIGQMLPQFGSMTLGVGLEGSDQKIVTGSGVRGEASQVRVWNRALDFLKDIPRLQTCANSIEEGLIYRLVDVRILNEKAAFVRPSHCARPTWRVKSPSGVSLTCPSTKDVLSVQGKLPLMISHFDSASCPEINQSINQSIYQSIDQSIDQSINFLIVFYFPRVKSFFFNFWNPNGTLAIVEPYKMTLRILRITIENGVILKKHLSIEYCQCRAIDWLIDWLNDWLIDGPINWLIERLMIWLNGWWFDWSIDWLIGRSHSRSRVRKRHVESSQPAGLHALPRISHHQHTQRQNPHHRSPLHLLRPPRQLHSPRKPSPTVPLQPLRPPTPLPRSKPTPQRSHRLRRLRAAKSLPPLQHLLPPLLRLLRGHSANFHLRIRRPMAPVPRGVDPPPSPRLFAGDKSPENLLPRRLLPKRPVQRSNAPVLTSQCPAENLGTPTGLADVSGHQLPRVERGERLSREFHPGETGNFGGQWGFDWDAVECDLSLGGRSGAECGHAGRVRGADGAGEVCVHGWRNGFSGPAAECIAAGTGYGDWGGVVVWGGECVEKRREMCDLRGRDVSEWDNLPAVSARYRSFPHSPASLNERMIDWLMDRLIDWLIDWLNDWLIDWLLLILTLNISSIHPLFAAPPLRSIPRFIP